MSVTVYKEHHHRSPLLHVDLYGGNFIKCFYLYCAMRSHKLTAFMDAAPFIPLRTVCASHSIEVASSCSVQEG